MSGLKPSTNALDEALARGIADAEAGRVTPSDEAFRRIRADLFETFERGPVEQLDLDAIRTRIRRSLDDPRPDMSSQEVDAALETLFAQAKR